VLGLSSTSEYQPEDMQTDFRKRCADRGACDLCRHGVSIPGRMLCPVCLEAIERLAYVMGVHEDLTSVLRRSAESRSRLALVHGIGG
jgi:hypothetical protein